MASFGYKFIVQGVDNSPKLLKGMIFAECKQEVYSNNKQQK